MPLASIEGGVPPLKQTNKQTINLRIQGLQWCRYFARVFLLILSSRIMSKHLVFPSSPPPKIPTYSSNPLPPLSLTSKSTLDDLNMTPNASLLHPKAAIMMRVEPLLFLAFLTTSMHFDLILVHHQEKFWKKAIFRLIFLKIVIISITSTESVSGDVL